MSGRRKFRYRSFPAKRKHPYTLEPGMPGFLCTCNSKLSERDCVREAYNILNEFADKVFGVENKEDDKPAEEENVDEAEDIVEEVEKALKKEIDSLLIEINKKPETRRFQVVESGANGIVFIRTTVPDPVKLAHTIMISLSEEKKSKHLLRLLPVEVTCKAYLEDICSACDRLFDRYFLEEKTFAIVYNHRHNDRLKREQLIESIAAKVIEKNGNNKADLKNPQLAVLVEVIRNICCISVVPDFYTFKKYNLMELAPRSNIEPQKDKDETFQQETEF